MSLHGRAWRLALVPAALLITACLDETPTGPSAAASAREPQLQLAAGAGRFLVQFKAGAPQTLSTTTLAAAGGRVTGRIDHLNTLVLEGVRNPAALSAAPGVSRVEASLTFRTAPTGPRELASAATGDARPAATDQTGAFFFDRNQQWGLRTIRAPEAWAASRGGEGVNVCIIDTGISENHQDLAGKVVKRRSFVLNDPSDPSRGFSAPQLDSSGHGTHVAATITSNGIDAASVAPDAKLFNAKVFGATGPTSDAQVIAAIRWCTDEGAHVINMSLSGFTGRGSIGALTILQAGLDYATSRGVLLVAAAGNDNLQLPNPVFFVTPGELNGVLTVGATGPVSRQPTLPLRASTSPLPRWDPFDPAQVLQGVRGRAFYSQFGTTVDIFAPGGAGAPPLTFLPRGQGSARDDILSACSLEIPGCQTGDFYLLNAGTSMAAPHVAGVAALVRAELTPDSRNMAERVTQCILQSADRAGAISGIGHLDAKAAVDRAKAGLC